MISNRVLNTLTLGRGQYFWDQGPDELSENHMKFFLPSSCAEAHEFPLKPWPLPIEIYPHFFPIFRSLGPMNVKLFPRKLLHRETNTDLAPLCEPHSIEKETSSTA